MTKPAQRHWKQGPDPEYVDLLQALPPITWTKGQDRLMLTSIHMHESIRCIGWTGTQIEQSITRARYDHYRRWPRLPIPNWTIWRHAPTQSWIITRTH